MCTQIAAAQGILTKLKEHPDAWRRVDAILEYATDPYTKFYGLQILEEAIKYRWRALPPEQREGVKNYIVKKIIDLSGEDASLQQNRMFLSKLNQTLVQVRVPCCCSLLAVVLQPEV